MKYFVTLIGILVCWIPSLAQDTWERHHIGSSGGSQSNSSYSVTTAMHAYHSGHVQCSSISGNSGFLYPELHTLPPVITGITDVPNDQGKQVQIVWNKSDYDDSYAPDKFYSVWRRDQTESVQGGITNDPLDVIIGKEMFWFSDGEIWTYIDTVPALVFPEYSLIAPTLFDSVASGTNYSTFKVLFHDLYQYYESEADSGYSVDNLEPSAPVLWAELSGNGAELIWTSCNANDFQYFALYRSDDPENFPSTPFQTTIDTSFIDPFLVFDTVYYVVTAFDFNGNESLYSNIEHVTDNEAIVLQVKIFLEGPFNVTEMNTTLNLGGHLPLNQPYNQLPWSYMGTETVASIPTSDIVDWVLIELRDAPDAASASSATTVAQKAGFLLKYGSIVSADGFSMMQFSNVTIQHSLFAVLWHRNHIGIMSATPLVETGGIFAYDFTTGAGQVHGGSLAHKEIASGIWGMAAADGNADGQINNGDKNDVWAVQAGGSGYMAGDFNMDTQVNNGDKNDLWVPNTGMGGQVPDAHSPKCYVPE